MGRALLFGILASLALIIGGAVGSWWKAPMKLTGIMLAFASGSLIAALAFELFPEAVNVGGIWWGSAGLFAGAAVFVIVNGWLDSHLAPEASAEDEQREKMQEGSRGVGLALLAAVTLDGLPENIALGESLTADTASFVLLVAIFVSNLPESLVGAIAMRNAGRSRTYAIGVWSGAAVVLTAAVLGGYALGEALSPKWLAFMLAFAGGAVLASLADTLMPEAFERGRPINAFATALGFLLSFILAAQV